MPAWPMLMGVAATHYSALKRMNTSSCASAGCTDQLAKVFLVFCCNALFFLLLLYSSIDFPFLGGLTGNLYWVLFLRHIQECFIAHRDAYCVVICLIPTLLTLSPLRGLEYPLYPCALIALGG